MALLESRNKIARASKLSHEKDRVFFISIAGTGKLRIDGNYIILIKEDGTYHRLENQQLYLDMVELSN
ncbi:MAG: hypothetical protein ABIK68_08760 [bacterium]